MKLLFRQPSMGWCSVYMLANLFREQKFLKFTYDEKYKGCSDEDLNFMLSELEIPVKLNTIACSCENYGNLPKQWIWETIFKNEVNQQEVGIFDLTIIPYLLSVQLVPGINHHVSIFILKDQIFYIDPYKESIIELKSYADFDIQFIGCLSVERFMLTDGSKRFAVFSGKDLGYEFLNKITLVP